MEGPEGGGRKALLIRLGTKQQWQHLFLRPKPARKAEERNFPVVAWQGLGSKEKGFKDRKDYSGTRLVLPRIIPFR